MSQDERLLRAIADLGMSQTDIREAAVRQIEQQGEAAIPELLEALSEDQLGGAGRGLVLRLLGALAIPTTLPAIAAALNDTRYETRAAAVSAVARFPGPEANALLRGLLGDSDRDIARQAAALLAERTRLGEG